MNIQKKFVIYTFSCLLLSFICNSSIQSHPIQRLEVSSTLNPVGSGARAFGMGDAYIAVADDATAASWNPAALNNLEHPELSLVAVNYQNIEKNNFGTNPEANGIRCVYKNSLNYFSLTYPFEISTSSRTYPIVLSLNYQNLYNFDREWRPTFFLQTEGFVLKQNIDYIQSGNLSALGLAGCIEIIKNLSVGLTINIWNSELTSNNWEKKVYQIGSGTNEGHEFVFTYTAYDKYEFNGFNVNFNIGALWKKEYPNHSINIGTVIKTPFRADITHQSKYQYSLHYLEKEDPEPDNSYSYDEKDTVDLPLSYGIGVACVFDKLNLKVDIDLYITDWDDYIITEPNVNDDSYKDTIKVCLGMEYLFFRENYINSIIPLRTGLFYDPVPEDDYYGFSLGFGIHKDKFHFDVGYQYRFGNNVSKYRADV